MIPVPSLELQCQEVESPHSWLWKSIRSLSQGDRGLWKTHAPSQRAPTQIHWSKILTANFTNGPAAWKAPETFEEGVHCVASGKGPPLFLCWALPPNSLKVGAKSVSALTWWTWLTTPWWLPETLPRLTQEGFYPGEMEGCWKPKHPLKGPVHTLSLMNTQWGLLSDPRLSAGGTWPQAPAWLIPHVSSPRQWLPTEDHIAAPSRSPWAAPRMWLPLACTRTLPKHPQSQHNLWPASDDNRAPLSQLH